MYPDNYLETLQNARTQASDNRDYQTHWLIDAAIASYLGLSNKSIDMSIKTAVESRGW